VTIPTPTHATGAHLPGWSTPGVLWKVEGLLDIAQRHYPASNMVTLAHLVIAYFGLRVVVNLVVAVATGLMF